MRKTVSVGPSIFFVLDTYVIATGSSRRAVARRLIDLSLNSEHQPPLRHDRYLQSGEVLRNAPGGKLTLDEPEEWWARIDARAKRYGENRSESVRALIMGGTIIEPEPREDVVRIERIALQEIKAAGEINFSALGRKLWPQANVEWGGFNGTYAARTVCVRLRDQGLVQFHEPKRGWRKTPLSNS